MAASQVAFRRLRLATAGGSSSEAACWNVVSFGETGDRCDTPPIIVLVAGILRANSAAFVPSSSSSSDTTLAMVGGRSPGSFASIRAMRPSSAGGIPGLSDDARGGCSEMWATSRSPGASFSNT